MFDLSETYVKERQLKVKKNKTNSLDWFIRKYGKDLGKNKYEETVIEKMNVLSVLKANRFSIISQELFWSIYNKLEDKENIYFHDLNFEFVFKIPEKYKHENTVMMFDFKQNNKIIEYNGKYWHNTINDNIRYSILKNEGFDVLVINSEEFNRNNKNEKIIDKCINYLKWK